MNRSFKQQLFLIAFGVVLFVGLMNLDNVIGFVGTIAAIILPVFIGLMLAFVLNVPVCGTEKILWRLFKNRKRKPKESTITTISTIAVLLIIVGVIALVVTLVAPEIAFSVRNVSSLVREKWPQWVEFLSEHGIDISALEAWFDTTNLQGIIDSIISGSGTILDTVIGAAATTISGLVTAAFSVVIALYILFSKKSLGVQTKKIMTAYIKPKYAQKIMHIASLSQDTYAKFLSGQCVEAIILGTLIFIALTIFRLPYAALMAVVAAVCAFIPYIGAFAAVVIGAFLTLIADPSKTIVFLIVYCVVQFIETQFIYPHVVGNSVGLSALWTLIAALVGGNLLGLVGIIFFIPLTAVIYTLAKEAIEERIKKRNGGHDETVS